MAEPLTANDGMPMTAEDVLLQAADAIAEHGHTKGIYGNERQGFCAMGAMRHAIGNSGALWPLYSSAEALLGNSLPIQGPDAFHAICQFNDDPGTTGEDVILQLKKAAHHDH